jgi:Helix-turn-helix domain
VAVVIPEKLLDDLTGRVAEQVADRLANRLDKLAEPGKRWVDVQGAADYLAFSVSKLQKLTTRNQIPHHHHDGRVHYRTDELDIWLTNH